ncbi:hypothetical protein JTB14_013623 [Gonioctena quinquepunctata]|nr:hypothetical protein JTB14_013623 [Gonioctena quinquepunctata]
MNSENIERFNNILCEETWLEVSNNDINIDFERFSSIISHFFNLSFPITKYSNRRQRKKKEWMNEDLCKLRSEICLFSDLSKKYPELKNYYKELNKQYSLELSKAKRSHIDNKINSSTNKRKATWNIISEIQGKNVKNRQPT